MQTRTLSTLVAVFRTDPEARAAADELRANGFGADDIFITAANTTDTNEIAARDYRRHEGGIKGWFHSLFGEEQNETDAAANDYERAISTGNVLLSVDTNNQNIDRAADILNRHSPIDVQRDRTSNINKGAPAESQTGVRPTGATDARTGAIPVVREELKIGKRAILRGGVRVYSRMVEEPVQETIGLREEHVRVDRVPVNRDITNADLQTGREKVIEVKEYAEEPVVSKTSRVVEEVRVHKDAVERQETVRDSVRRTEIEVENFKGTGSEPSTAYDPNDYNADFRRDFDQRYGTTGQTFDTYSPAYNYGYQMADDPRYSGRDFDEAESDLRADYSQRYPNSTWDRMKDAVRYGWNRLTHPRR